MKTSRFFTMALCAMVVAMGATSCRKDDKGIAGDRMTIGANIVQHGGDGSKTAIGPEAENQFPVLWSDGDAFTLYSQSSTEGTTFGITSGAGSESAVFEGANPGGAPYFASYPAGVTRTGATTFIYEIPQDQSDLNHAGPMVGYSADGQSVDFENAASWVRIGLKGNAKVTKVELGSKVSKSHPSSALFGQLRITVGDDGKIVGTTVMDNKADHSMLEKAYTTPVELNPDEFTYFDFLVPEGAFGDLNKAHGQKAQFKVFGTDDAVLATFEKEMPAIQRNKVYVGVYETAINEAPATPKFTVDADGTTVEFAPGNLWYGIEDGKSEPAFHFEEHQWDFLLGLIIDDDIYEWNPSHVSYFFWSKDAKEAVKENFGDSHVGNSDVFFTNDPNDATEPNPDFEVNGEKGDWRTLSKAEWDYLLSINPEEYTQQEGYGRENALSLNKWSAVTFGESGPTVSGLIIMPDGYDFSTTPLTDGEGTTSYERWQVLEASGAVFLPAVGYREGMDMYDVGWKWFGYYSSSTLYEGFAGCLDFYSDNVYTTASVRSIGYSVRLVRDVK